MRILTRAESNKLGINLRPALVRVLELFKNQQPAAFTDDTAAGVSIERPNRFGRRIVHRLGEPLEQSLAYQSHRIKF